MQEVFDAIDPAKDVDGVTPDNVGRLVQNRAKLIACTPAGIMEMLARNGIAARGRRAVVVGRSAMPVWYSIAIFAVALYALIRFRVEAVWVIPAAGAAGWWLY